MSEQRHPETLHQPGSAPGAKLHIVDQGSVEPFFDPKNSTHTDLFTADVNHILIDRRNSGLPDERVVAIASLAITAFSTIMDISDPGQQADPEELKQLQNTAASLKRDSNASYLLSVVDETVEPVETRTPIVISKFIKRVHALHSEPAASLLLTKLWVVQRMDTDMPSDYLKHLEAEPQKPEKTPRTYVIANIL